MDSGNSGSMQSSSGGEEEYDSRSDSISAFINSSGATPPPSTQHHSNQSLFDPLSNLLDAFPRSPAPPTMNSFLNLDAAWNNRGQQSGPNCTDMGRGMMGPPSMSISDRDPFPIISNSSSISPSMQFQAGSENGGHAQASVDQQNGSRNPKKRSRASRRAPTTVLTTDTSNFRAMVQEFTGIPAPPFSSSPFPRARLDLFNSASSMRSALSNSSLPSYLLRPFAQKLQQHQVPTSIFASQLPLSTTSSSITTAMVDAVSSANTASINAANIPSTGTTTTSASTNTFQLPSDLGLLKPHSNLLNPSFTFQSSAPKYPFSSAPAVGAKTQGPQAIPSTGSHLKMGLLPLDGFGVVNQGRVDTQLGTLTDLVGSDAMPLRSNDPSSWGDHGIGSNYSNSQRVSSCKMNYNTGPSSDFHAEKGSENVSSRGEGMVDSWICSTD